MSVMQATLRIPYSSTYIAQAAWAVRAAAGWANWPGISGIRKHQPPAGAASLPSRPPVHKTLQMVNKFERRRPNARQRR
jgi:hypothetical protein